MGAQFSLGNAYENVMRPDLASALSIINPTGKASARVIKSRLRSVLNKVTASANAVLAIKPGTILLCAAPYTHKNHTV